MVKLSFQGLAFPQFYLILTVAKEGWTQGPWNSILNLSLISLPPLLWRQHNIFSDLSLVAASLLHSYTGILLVPVKWIQFFKLSCSCFPLCSQPAHCSVLIFQAFFSLVISWRTNLQSVIYSTDTCRGSHISSRVHLQYDFICSIFLCISLSFLILRSQEKATVFCFSADDMVERRAGSPPTQDC